MPVTRDAEFPAEAAQLMQAFNRCADGHDMRIVVEASAQMFSASLHNYGAARGFNRETTMALAQDACAMVVKIVADNIDRHPLPSDVKVDAQ